MKRRIQINGFILAAAVLTVCVFPRGLLRTPRMRADFFVQVVGFALLCVGLLLRVSSRGYKSENSQSSKELVTAGPYSLVRNPMYLGITAIGVGVIMVAFQWWVLVVFACFMLMRYLTLIFKEEQLLTDRFGEAYSAYCARTPRFIPNFFKLSQKRVREYFPLRASWFKREASSVILVPLASVLCALVSRIYLAKQVFSAFQIGVFLGLVALISVSAVAVIKDYEKYTAHS